jgi:PPP family 3-phenylpropionic acid transporter
MNLLPPRLRWPAPASDRGAVARRLQLFYVFLFMVPGIHLPFWPLWLAAQGLNEAAIGLALAAGNWARVIANPLAGHFADRNGERRRLMLALTVLCLCSFALFAVARELGPLIAVSLLFGLFWGPLMPLCENMTLLACYRHRLDYGRIRLWGSLSFMVTATAAGFILQTRSADAIYVMMLLALVGAALVAIGLPDIRVETAPAPVPGGAGPRRAAPFGALLRERRYLIMLAAAAAIHASHGVLYAFGTLHWRAAGHSNDVIGLLWAVGVIAEIGVFAVGGALLRRLGPAELLLIASAVGALRWSGMALTTELALLAALQALHALSFGIAHLGAMHMLAQELRPEISASAQGYYSVVNGGVALGAAMLAAGPLYAAFGGASFWFMAALAAAGGGAALFLLPRRSS